MPFTFLYAAFVNHRSFRHWFASAVLAGVLFAALVSPWLIRNEGVFGRPVFFRSNYWFEFHLGNYHFSNGLGFSGKHPGANAAVFKKYAVMGEMGFLDYYKEDGLRFVREYPSEFLDLTLHRTWWFWDGTSLLYQSREWWRPWEFWPLSLGGWLGLLFVLTRRPRGWLLFAAALIIYPIGIAIAVRSSADSTAKPGDVNEARVTSDAATGNNWMVNGRTNDSKHFSPLKQINDQNAGNLGLAWYLDYDGAMGIVSEPIVVDGIIYVSAPLSKVYAVEASTGKLLWKYDPQIRLDQALNGSYSARTNGGVAVWNGKVYVGTGDCRLIAIDAATAKKIWEATVCEPLQTGITGAPRVAKGKVLMGYNGSDDGVRGAP